MPPSLLEDMRGECVLGRDLGGRIKLFKSAIFALVNIIDIYSLRRLFPGAPLDSYTITPPYAIHSAVEPSY